MVGVTSTTATGDVPSVGVGVVAVKSTTEGGTTVGRLGLGGGTSGNLAALEMAGEVGGGTSGILAALETAGEVDGGTSGILAALETACGEGGGTSGNLAVLETAFELGSGTSGMSPRIVGLGGGTVGKAASAPAAAPASPQAMIRARENRRCNMKPLINQSRKSRNSFHTT